jgi:NADH-quinone oxidoreductase subunit A
MSQSLTELLVAYLPLVVFIGVAAVIGLALLVVAFLVAYKEPNPEKLSAYECGFNAFDDARMKFDVRFYLVAILSAFCFRGRWRSGRSAFMASGR